MTLEYCYAERNADSRRVRPFEIVMTPQITLPKYQHFIDGAPLAPSSGEYLATDDPYSGATWAHIARGN
jgi:hypothetical protein